MSGGGALRNYLHASRSSHFESFFGGGMGGG